MNKIFLFAKHAKTGEDCNKFSRSVSYETLVGETTTECSAYEQNQRLSKGGAGYRFCKTMRFSYENLVDRLLQTSLVFRLVKVLGLAAVLSMGMLSESWAYTCTFTADPNNSGKYTLNVTGGGTFTGCNRNNSVGHPAPSWEWSTVSSSFVTSATLDSTGIGSSAFASSNSLTNISMPNVTSIGDWAFHNVEGLTTVDMPNVRTIGLGAFENTRALKSVDMPNVTTVGKQAFQNATSLESVSMPNATTIGWGAFRCDNGKSSLKSVDMPNVTTIETVAFYNANSLESVNMPNVTTIKNDAFSRTQNLKSITISDSADTIESQAFYSSRYADHDVNYTDVNCIENPATENTCEQVKALMKQARAPLKDDAFYIITSPTPNCGRYSQGVCSTCVSGYHTADSSCVANPPNCKVFAGNACSECSTGYLAKESGCVEPSSCTGEYLISGNTCIKMPGCVDYADNKCQVCDSDYLTNSEGSCTPVADCKNGLHADGGACVANPEGCNTFANNKCTECNSGLIKQEGACVSGCGASFRLNDGECDRIRYTPAEAAQYLKDTDNEIIMTFKVNR